ncbi:rolling circle replication-associated protein [Citrobacter freundii]|uniref:rolling circle replication-associated protein n=1 Tax=Citrobacter freundii TaxID=546 RepID=UPI001BCE8F6D|nr:inovirus-type Gp2 protein [Citrobacter freundii]
MNHNINRNHVPDNSLQDNLFDHQNQLFSCHSKLLMLRVDFAYRKDSESFNHADMNQLVADMVWLTEQRTTISGLVGYAWVLEYGEDHRYHIHAAFYIDGQCHRKVWCFWEAIRELWDEITDGEGYAHRCEPKAHYRVRGERVTSYDDVKGRKGMQYILSYLSKQDQKDEKVTYQLSYVPATSRRGRPRVGR